MTMNSPTWTSIATPDSAVAVSAQNKYGYLLTPGGDVHFYDISWTQLSLPTSDPSIFVSAGYDGSLISITHNNSAFLLNQYGWNQLSGNITAAAVGDNNSYVYCTSSGMESVTNGSGSTIPTPVAFKQISTTAGNTQVWAIDDGGNVYYKDGNIWQGVSGKTLVQIHVSLSAAGSVQVCGVDYQGTGWLYNVVTGAWTSVTKPSGVTDSFVSLEAGNNYIWAAFGDGSVHRGNF